MAKEVILYNLREGVDEKEYEAYVRAKKGPLFKSFRACKKYTLVRIMGSQKGTIPYRYVGIVDIEDSSEWAKQTKGEAFQQFLKEWLPMVSEFFILTGEEVFEE